MRSHTAVDGAAVKAQRSGALSYCSACLGGEPERAGRQLHVASHTRKSSADFRTKACSFFICHIRPCPFSVQRRPPTHSGGRRCILIFGSIQEGRRKRTVCSGSSAISIPAPVWERPLHIGPIHFIRVLIPAPAWGATQQGSPAGISHSDFNSRPHVGGDWRQRLSEALLSISIHAPV